MSTRREILKLGPTAAAFGATLGYASALRASATSLSDYKALVCIYMKGGNDCYNTLIPVNTYHYERYQAARGDAAIPHASLKGMRVRPQAGWGEGRHMALHPSLAPLKDLFDAGDLALALNVGPLEEPVEGRHKLASRHIPQSLYSHGRQSALWREFDAGTVTGWGGRLARALVQQYEPENAISVRSAVGPTPFFGLAAIGNQSHTHITNCYAAGGEMVTCDGLDYWGRTGKARAITRQQKAELIDAGASSLHRQLALVATEISVGARSGPGRQVFFCEMGGFDSHHGAVVSHASSLSILASAMAAFQATLEDLGAAQNVVTFTASEFGRTLKADGDGSDHGWGGHHFVMGKPVAPRSVFGRLPSYEIDAYDDAGDGRLIPDVSVEQYSSLFARWMGVPASDLSRVSPAINRFDVLPEPILI
ncbi:MAG: DUF1501 domain-containing protein [Pseudomonadota bacterium]